MYTLARPQVTPPKMYYKAEFQERLRAALGTRSWQGSLAGRGWQLKSHTETRARGMQDTVSWRSQGTELRTGGRDGLWEVGVGRRRLKWGRGSRGLAGSRFSDLRSFASFYLLHLCSLL